MAAILSSLTEAFKFQRNLLNQHPVHRRLALFIGCLAVSFLIFFFRNPDPFINPVFYAEDGSSYVGPILSRGFWSALFYTRSDYFVFGNIILTEIAVAINNIFYPESILYLPQVIALVSYLFYAIVATLPILIFASRIRLLYLIALALISSFFPLQDSDYEVIGRISNVGYAFVYIAFLLIYYRIFCVKNLAFILLIDFLIFICANTNPVVYIILPAIYIPYLKNYFIDKISLNRILNNYSFLSAVIISTILLLEAAKIITTGAGLHPASGHLDSPFVLSNAIEMLVARSILYPVIYPIYRNMNDITVILIFIVLIIGFIRFSNKENHGLYVLGFYSLIVFTVAAALFRPGLSGFLKDYSSTWPAQYYYGQNLLATFLIVLLFHDISSNLRILFLRRALLVLLLTMFLAGWRDLSTYGHPANSLREIGNFEQALVAALRAKSFVNISNKPELTGKAFTYTVTLDETGEFLEVPIYLPPFWKMIIPRDLAKKSAEQGKLINMLNKCQ